MFGSRLDCRGDNSRIRVVDFASILNVGRAHALEEAKEGEMPTAKDVAFLCFTSGTTGMPKAAMINHENMVENGFRNSSSCVPVAALVSSRGLRSRSPTTSKRFDQYSFQQSQCFWTRSKTRLRPKSLAGGH